jgi:hypothetical protein
MAPFGSFVDKTGDCVAAILDRDIKQRGHAHFVVLNRLHRFASVRIEVSVNADPLSLG